MRSVKRRVASTIGGGDCLSYEWFRPTHAIHSPKCEQSRTPDPSYSQWTAKERFLGVGHYERTTDRRGYANGYKSKRIDTPAGTVNVAVPKTAGETQRLPPN